MTLITQPDRHHSREQSAVAKVMPYITIAVLVGGWLVQYGYHRAEIDALQRKVHQLIEQQRVTNGINYREHPAYWPEILAAEKE